MTKLIKSEYVINGIDITEYTDEDKKHHVEALKTMEDNDYVGHGNTAFEAILDLEARIKKLNNKCQIISFKK